MIIQMKTKEKSLKNDPVDELCNECKRRTIELTLESIGVPTHAADAVLKNVEYLERRHK